MRPAEIYEELFCLMYQVPAPAVVLGEVIHWWAIVRGVGLDGLAINKQKAFVPAGFFYATHIDPPDAAAVERAHRAAVEHEADWVLFPVVRAAEPADALRAAGFVPVPWFVEAEYRLRESVDTDLRGQLGKNRHGDLRRAARRAGEQYRFEVLSGAEITPGVLATFDRLHALNLHRYGHKHNHLSLAALELILASPLGAGLRVFLRHPLDGGPPVQAALNLLDDGGRTMSFVAQGIDHDAVPTSQNLYKAWFYELYHWGADRGVEVFALGRGAELNKLDMGANTFHLLDNHLAPVDGADTSDVLALRGALAAEFDGIGERLRAGLAGRRAASEFEVRW